MYSEHWNPDGRSTDSDADPIDEDDTFEAEPVEDPIPDPTFSSVSQSLKTYFKDMGILFRQMLRSLKTRMKNLRSVLITW